MRFGLWLMAAMTATWAAHGGEQPALEASAGVDGQLKLSEAGKALCHFECGVYDSKWAQASALADMNAPAGAIRPLRIKTPSGVVLAGEVAFDAPKPGTVRVRYAFTPEADVQLNALHVTAVFPIEALAGKPWKAGEKEGSFPKEFGEVHLTSGEVTRLQLELAHGRKLTLDFDAPTAVLLQDNRKWGPQFVVRIGPQGTAANLKKGVKTAFGFTLSTTEAIAFSQDGPVTITAGAEWIPLNLELDIEAGSALDFSKLGFHDAPAGKHGRVIATPEGHFAFEKEPAKPQRFYGANFCFGAQYLEKDQCAKLAERLMRLGYNTVRLHHYEGELISGQANSTTLNPDKLDRLDCFVAECIQRGLYITTDLFVSRPVPWKEIGVDKPGNVPMDHFKIMIPVHAGAKENFKRFSRALLEHVNPYTKRSWAEEPAIAWLSLINEGNFGNFMSAVREIPEWTTAWNAWLTKQYPGREQLAAAWDTDLKAQEDAAKGSVELPANIWNDGPRVRDCLVFFAEVERALVTELTKFLREELKCKALVTNSNAWTNPVCYQPARMVYDYVDDHYYIDHPHFIDKSWRLPSRCPNTSPVAGGASGGRGNTFTRLFGKPFTISEYNYSGPGKFRGVGGILTGAMGALQDWDVIWRFAYSHNKANLFAPGTMGYFDMAGDPLGLASERASLCLFMRRDMRPASGSLAVLMTPEEAAPKGKLPNVAPRWHWAAWVTRVGTQVTGPGDALKNTAVLPMGAASRTAAGIAAAKDLEPYTASNEAVMALLKERGLLKDGNRTDPMKNIFESETGEILIDAPNDVMILDTPRTAGAYAPAGRPVKTRSGGVGIEMLETSATVWVSALDGKELPESTRLLVTHLTDLQNTEIKYAEKARQTLLAWGKLPHLVWAGKARVRIVLKEAQHLKVWALSSGGKRLAEVKVEVKDGVLEFTADVAADPAQARMLYEIAKP